MSTTSSSFYTPHIYSADDKESMLKRSSALATAEGSYAEKIPSDKPGELWLRHFLIDHSTNKRGWSISKQTSWQNVLSAIGGPIVLKIDESSHSLKPA